eukprot:TRINITY_DN2390_c0_g1_i3.p1 TRINITY_DN2390_c0_g1~~TRINITY_DN2390_c0_g1_i3.p1  ORF type:complete len:379 (-),score=129.66 TRINITY_DN2390_c0_g1_i3:209-1345(-)
MRLNCQQATEEPQEPHAPPDAAETVEDTDAGSQQGDNMMLQQWYQMRQPVPFELAMLEAMLQEYCNSQQRRLRLMRHLVADTLTRATTSSTTLGNARIDFYKMVPINVALKNFELSTAEARRCLTDLLHNDDDMLDLMLTAKHELGPGEMLDETRHQEVELLLENYHRQLSITQNEISKLVQEVQSTQELAGINLDISRNRMLHMEIQLAMMNVSVACCAAIFGVFGMNVANGIEHTEHALPGVVGLGLASGGILYGAWYMYMRMRVVRRSLLDEGESKELHTLGRIFGDLSNIETVIRSTLELQAGSGSGNATGGGDRQGRLTSSTPLDRAAMRTLLEEETGHRVNDAELDLIFRLFDTKADGWIGASDYKDLGIVK